MIESEPRIEHKILMVIARTYESTNSIFRKLYDEPEMTEGQIFRARRNVYNALGRLLKSGAVEKQEIDTKHANWRLKSK